MVLTEKEVKKWITPLMKESQEGYDTSQDLFKSKKYHFALFFCHLTIEKSLKAKFLLQNKKFAPPVHDLVYIVKKLQIKLSQETLSQLTEINTFNLRARYDDYKREFYKKATSEYAKLWLKVTNNLLILFKK